MTKKIRAPRILAFSALLVLGSPLAFAQQSMPGMSGSSSSVDNTRMNQRDRSAQTLKPTDQPNNRTDIKLAAAVRRAIVHDKTLSMKAHNVKLIARGGVVTLRGPVASEQEKMKVAALVARVAGVTRVDNQLDVKTHTRNTP